MKRKLLFVAVFSMVFICCGKTEFKNPVDLFSKINVKQYTSQVIDYDTKLSEGAEYCVLRNKKNKVKEIFRVILFSSSGQTQYYVFEDAKTKVWYVKKAAFFYEEPFKVDDAEIKYSYFCYKDSVPYLYNSESGKYEENVDIDFMPAVVDYRHLNELITDVEKLSGHR